MEVSALEEILSDVETATNTLLERQQLCSNPQRKMVWSCTDTS